MRVKGWMILLGVMLLFSPVAGAAPAGEVEPPAATVEEVLPIFLAGGQCVCRCTCPTSGSFQYQCVAPPAGGCGALNGQRCNVTPASLCAQQDIFSNCVPEQLAPVPCN